MFATRSAFAEGTIAPRAHDMDEAGELIVI